MIPLAKKFSISGTSIQNFHTLEITTTSANEVVGIPRIQTDDSGAQIDWGDGSSVQNVINSYNSYDGSTNPKVSHTYSTAGNYTIRITGKCFFSTMWNYATGQTYCKSWKKIFFGKNLIVPSSGSGTFGFTSCEQLQEVHFLYNPDNPPIDIPSYSEEYSTNSYSMGTLFNRCKSLTYADIPMFGTSIGDGMFDYCTKLTSVAFGPNLNSISMSWADSTASIVNWDFTRAKQVPVFANSTSYTKFSKYFGTNPKFYVPANLLNEWKTAAYWSNQASNIVSI